MNKQSRTNSVLLAIIGVMGLALIVNSGGGSMIQRAEAQPADKNDPPFNASEQRKQIIAALTTLNAKVASMEAKLNGQLSVKVTEMPPVVIKEMPKDSSGSKK